MTTNHPEFSLGTRVTWKSQANGSQTTKTGTIMALVPPKADPQNCIPAGFRCDIGTCCWRNYWSYLVRVDGKGRQLYWPRVNLLKQEGDTP